MNLQGQHLVLGKVTSELTTQQKSLIQEVLSEAQFDKSIVYHHLIINGAIYTSFNYQRQTTACDHIVTLMKNGLNTVGFIEMFVSVCVSSCACSSPYKHFALVELPTVVNMYVSADSVHQLPHKHHHYIERQTRFARSNLLLK